MKMQHNKTWLAWLRYLALLMVLIALAANIDLLGLTWASGDKIGENIFTDVELSVITVFDNGVPSEYQEINDYIDNNGPFPNPHEDDYDPLPLSIRYDFELPDGHEYGHNDYYEFQLPSIFKIYSEIAYDDPGELRDGNGILFGTFTLDLVGNVRITFNNYIEGRRTLGWLAFQTELVTEELEGFLVEDTIVPIREEDFITITLYFQPLKQDSIYKIGLGDRAYNTEKISWQVDFNKIQETINNPVLKDLIQVNQTLVPGSIQLFKLNGKLDGTVEQGDLVDPNFYVVEAIDGLEDNDFQLRFIAEEGETPIIDSAYRLIFTTSIGDEDGTSYSNSATLTGTNINDLTASASVAVSRGNPLAKRFIGYVETTQTISWEIRANYNEKTLLEEDAIIRDTMGSNQKLVPGSLEVCRVLIGPDGSETYSTLLEAAQDYELITGYDNNAERNFFEIHFPDGIDTAHRVNFQTTAVDRVFENAIITNTVTFNGINRTASRSIQQMILSKTHDQVNFWDKTVRWTIRVNRDSYEMKDLLLTDLFTNQGLTFKADSLVIEGYSGNYDFQLTDDGEDPAVQTGLNLDFDETITGPLTIRFVTYFDYEQRANDALNYFENRVTATWKDEKNDEQTISVTRRFTPDTYTQANGFKSGSYIAEAKEITWTVGVNYNLQTVNDAKVIDYIIGDQTLIEDSIMVYNAILPGGSNQFIKGDLIENAEIDTNLFDGSDNPGFSVNLGNITSAYIIEYKTSLEGYLTEAPLANIAYLYSGVNLEVELTAPPVSVPARSIYARKNYIYTSGRIINWAVDINPGQSTINNVVVTDALLPADKNLLIEESVNLFTASVNTNGTLTKGTEVDPADYSIEIGEEGDTWSFRVALFNGGEINRAYRLEYQSFVLAKHNETVSNGVELTANTIITGTTESTETITVRITTGVGGIYNDPAYNIDPVALKVIKAARVDGEVNSDIKLAGVDFDLYYLVNPEDPDNPDSRVYLRYATTDQEGLLQFDNLSGGRYVLVEKEVPTGYVFLDGSTALKENGETIVDIKEGNLDPGENQKTVTVVNDKILNAAELVKIDSVTREPIPNVWFYLLDQVGEIKYLRQTDDDGKIYIENLEPGTYWFKEQNPAKGYLRSDVEYPVTIDSDQIIIKTLEVANVFDADTKISVKKYISVDSGDTWLDADIAEEGPFVEVGAAIQYKFIVQNIGNVTLTDLTLSDNQYFLDANLPNSLAPGADNEYVYIFNAIAAKGAHSNTASASGKYDNNPYEDTDVAHYFGTAPSITLAKVGAIDVGAEPVKAGDTITYIYTVENTGNVTLTDVSVSEEEEDFGGTFANLTAPAFDSSTEGSPVGTLQPGEKASFTASYTLTQADIIHGEVKNKAAATGSPPVGSPVTNDSADIITLGASPEIAIVKEGFYQDTDDNNEVSPGDSIIYIYTVTNNGNVPLTDISVIEIEASFSGNGLLPVPVYQSSSGSSSLGSLLPGENAIYRAQYTLIEGDINERSIINKARATAKFGTVDVESDPDEAVVSYIDADLELTKTALPTTYSFVGQKIEYSFSVRNTGNVTLTNITIEDPLPGLILQGGPITLEPGETKETAFTGTYLITATDLSVGSRTNTATVTGSYSDGNGGSQTVQDSDSETIIKSQSTTVLVTKSLMSVNGDPAVTVFSEVGDLLAYEITFTNTGNIRIYNPLIIDEKATTSPTLIIDSDTNGNGTLDPDETWLYRASYRVTQEDLDRGNFINTATGRGSADTNGDGNGDLLVTGESSVDTNAAQQPQISILKNGSPQAYVDADDQIEYTFTVTNTGNVTLSNVRVEDPLISSSSLAVVPPTLAPGATGSATATYTIIQADVDRGNVENTATAKGTPPEGEDVSATGTDTLTGPVQKPSLVLTKNAGVSQFASVGEVVTYNFTVTNNGNVTLTDVRVNDPLTGSVDLAVSPSELAPGQSGTASAAYTVTQADLNRGNVENSATAMGTPPGPETVTVEDDDTAVVMGPAHNPALSLEKTASSPTYLASGEVITYTFRATNTGNVTLTEVAVNDPLTGSLNLAVSPATLAPGDVGSVTAIYTVTETDLYNGFIHNEAETTGRTPVGNLAGATDTARSTYTTSSGIRLLKYVSVDGGSTWDDANSAPGPSITAGSSVRFRFRITNTYTETLSNITLNDNVFNLGSIPLPAVLEPGETYVYTLSGLTATVGQHTNVATAGGSFSGQVFSDSDTANYYGNYVQPPVPPLPPQPSPPLPPQPSPPLPPQPSPPLPPLPSPPLPPQPSPSLPTQPAPTTPSPGQQQPATSQPPAAQTPPSAPAAPPQPPAADDPSGGQGPEDSAQRRTRTVTETTLQDQVREGTVEMPGGSVARIGDFPSNGIVTVDEDGNWVYTPHPRFSGEDRFTIIIKNADGSEEEVTLIIDVEEPVTEPEGDGQGSSVSISTPRTSGMALASLYSLWLILAASFVLRRGFVEKVRMAFKLRE